MAWIESHQGLLRHRKTNRACLLLGIGRYELIGHLHTLWWWALDNVPADGDLGDLSDAEIAAGAEWESDPAAWVTALTTAGFIDVGPEGRRALHDWYDYAGKLMDKRAADRDRKRRLPTNPPAADIQRNSIGIPTETPRTSDGGPSEVAGNRTVPVPYLPDPAAATKARAPEDPAASGEESVTAALVRGWETYMGGTLSPPALGELLDATRGGDGRPALAPAVVIAGMQEAHDHNARTLAYLRRVLRRAADEGLTTLAAWTAAQAARSRASPSPRAKPEGPREDATVAGYRDAASRKAARQRTEVPGWET